MLPNEPVTHKRNRKFSFKDVLRLRIFDQAGVMKMHKCENPNLNKIRYIFLTDVSETTRFLGGIKQTARKSIKDGFSEVDGRYPSVIASNKLYDWSATKTQKNQSTILSGRCCWCLCRSSQFPAGGSLQDTERSKIFVTAKAVYALCGTKVDRNPEPRDYDAFATVHGQKQAADKAKSLGTSSLPACIDVPPCLLCKRFWHATRQFLKPSDARTVGRAA